MENIKPDLRIEILFVENFSVSYRDIKLVLSYFKTGSIVQYYNDVLTDWVK